MGKKVINSPIRWAGSKKKLLNEMLEKFFVCDKKNYIEVFLGSGVVMLNVLNNIKYLKYKNIFVNDINSNIISLYKLIQSEKKYVINEMILLVDKYNSLSNEEKSLMYYNIRDKFNSNCDEKIKSIYFYFLMKTGYNGVYRINSKGLFNVPFGKKERIMFDSNYIDMISKLIKDVKFYNMPWGEFLKRMKEEGNMEDSFIYCDPPYIPDDKSVYKKQMLYTEGSFEHSFLYDYFAKNKISNVMISMSDSLLANKIYDRLPFYKKNVMDIIRVVNPQKIFNSTEIAFINYKIKE